MFIHAYKSGSKSAKALAESLGIKRIKNKRSSFRGSLDKQVINWGCSNLPAEVLKCNVYNDPNTVSLASNKLHYFQLMERGAAHYVPRWTTDKEQAKDWMIYNRNDVVERHVLNGHSAEGLIIRKCDDVDDLGDAPLYTQYIKKTDEYRIHIFNGEVFFVQKKMRKLDVPDKDVNWQVRNHANGFIFANKDINAPLRVLHCAKEVMKVSGLDFGAVDVISQRNYEAFALEINTAPGLEGSTLEAYTRAFKEKME